MFNRTEKFDLLHYLTACVQADESGECRIPPLSDLSDDYGVSTAMLREQLGVARAFGFVEVQPRKGIHRLPYRFSPAVQTSLSYALMLDKKYFRDFSDLRRHIESNYWFEAMEKLSVRDQTHLRELVSLAEGKLSSNPPQLPHAEHRDLHMTIYGKLENIFVVGLLEGYWDAYEAVGYSQYTELAYLKSVWNYHRKIVDAICAGEYQEGYQLLLEHMDLISEMPGSQNGS